jgi:nucleoside-diphosphate-sugar epimerase
VGSVSGLALELVRVLLSGATGFIGSAAVLALNSKGFELCLLGRGDPLGPSSLLSLRLSRVGAKLEAQRIQADLSRPRELESQLDALDSVDAVCHIAAEIQYGAGDAERTRNINVESSLVLCRWAERRGIPFVMLGSVVAWGGDWTGVLRNEDSFPEELGLCQRFPYYQSKHEIQKALLSQSWKIPVRILCPGVVHGWGEDRKPTRRHLASLRKGSLNWATAGSVSLVGLNYVVSEIIAALSTPTHPGPQQKLLVDRVLSIADYFQHYSECLGRPRRFRVVPQWLGWALSQVPGVSASLGPASLHHNFVSKWDRRSEAEKVQSLKSDLMASLDSSA